MTRFQSRCTPFLVMGVFVLLAGAPAPADVLVFDRVAKTVSRVDSASLAVKAFAALPEVPTRAVVSPDGSMAAVLASRVEGPAQLSFCDLAAGTAGAPILLGGEPKELLLAPDGATLYALSRGKPKGFGNVQGSLAVFSLPERKKTAEMKLGAITGIGGFEKGGRLILGGGRAGGVKEHRIYVVRGTAVEYDVAGPDSPTSFRFGPDGRTAWALGWTSALVDFGDFSAPPVVTVSDVSGWGGSFERTPDGKLALVHSSDGKGISEVLIYALPAGKKLKKLDTASFGSRLVAGLAAVVDPATGKVGAQTSSFREPAVGAFLP